MKIAVTSASGSLGKEIIKASVEKLGAKNIVGLARTPDKASDLGVEIRPGDYNNYETLQKSFLGVKTVLLISGNDKPEHRIKQHRNVIEAAKTAGVQKIVYTSIQGGEKGNLFSPIVQSNRQTEKDLQESGLAWVVGRNGIYLEPDIEYLENYKKAGKVVNCAGDGQCGYVLRKELAQAYFFMLTEDKHNGKTYNLHGEAITQSQLVDYLNMTFGTQLKFCNITEAEYQKERVKEIGESLGKIIAGIYSGIKNGDFNNPSQFATATERAHISWKDYFSSLR